MIKKTDSHKYSKIIERMYTGIVIAKVIDSVGNSHGTEIFSKGVLFDNDEKVLKRANKWADNIISLLEKYEHI